MCRNGAAMAMAAPAVAPPQARGLRVPLSLHGAIGRQQQHHQQQQQFSSEEARSGPRKAFEPYHSKSVPKPEHLGAGAKAGAITTVMLRNIPNKYSQCTMMEEIDEVGFAGTYDFFYLPMDVQNRSNVGYAFIDFVSPVDAQRFLAMFKEHRFRKHQSRKISSVSTAHVQGLEANLRHFENRAVTHARNDQYRPVVILSGKRVDFDGSVAAAVAHGRAAWSSHSPPRTLPGPAAKEASGASSTCTSLAGVIPPPPGLGDDLPCAAGWRRQTSAPPSIAGAPPVFHSPPLSDSGSCTPPSLDGMGSYASPWQRALSEGAEPWPAKDAPIYLPLPTIPSVSKIFATCHLEDDVEFPMSLSPPISF